MDILICTHEKDPSPAFDSVEAYFSREFPDAALSWQRSGTVLTASLDTSGEAIARAFEALVKKHPGLSAEASYSYDVREGDTSAQWWGTTRIYSTTEDGETKIVSSSSTYWN